MIKERKERKAMSASIEELENQIGELSDKLEQVRLISIGAFETLRVIPKGKDNYVFNLPRPRTLDEKIQWLRHCYWNRHPLTYYLNDKYLFKYYCHVMFNDEYTVPLLGVWDSADDIDFDSLPETFVLKRTLSGGSFEVKIVDKSVDDLDYIRKIARSWLVDKRRVRARIIAEQTLEFVDDTMIDYKFYVANGRILFIMCVNMSKTGGTRHFSFYNPNFNQLNVTLKNHTPYKQKIDKPSCFDEMVELVKKIGQWFAFIRVDLYESNGKVYIGELTDAPFNGRGVFTIDWDKYFGRMIELPTEEQMQRDFAAAYEKFPNLKIDPVFLDETCENYTIIRPKACSDTLPLPPPELYAARKQRERSCTYRKCG